MNFAALTYKKNSFYKWIVSNANLDRFDEPFSPIIVPHELSVVKQLPVACSASLTPNNVCNNGIAKCAPALRISLFADFPIGDGLVGTFELISENCNRVYMRSIHILFYCEL